MTAALNSAPISEDGTEERAAAAAVDRLASWLDTEDAVDWSRADTQACDEAGAPAPAPREEGSLARSRERERCRDFFFIAKARKRRKREKGQERKARLNNTQQ